MTGKIMTWPTRADAVDWLVGQGMETYSPGAWLRPLRRGDLVGWVAEYRVQRHRGRYCVTWRTGGMVGMVGMVRGDRWFGRTLPHQPDAP